MGGIVFLNSFFTEGIGFGESGAFFEPEPVPFEGTDERFHMGVLFRAVEADPLTGNTAGGEGILVEPAGGLTAVIHAEGEVMPADPIGELCLERLVECAEPFDSATA